MKKNELKNLSSEEAGKRMNELKMELMKLRAQVSRGTPPENPGKIRIIKRNIARLLTYKRNKAEGKAK